MRMIALLALLFATQLAFAKKDKYVDYHAQAASARVEAETIRFFTQMGYVQDTEHTRQCNDQPSSGALIFRHTGEGQIGPNGLSRCVVITITPAENSSTVRVEVYDHLRGGISLPATKHYDADRIHKDWDAAFAAIAKASETQNQSAP
jgi:hypothetical protein